MARRLIRLKPGFDVALARQGYSVRSFTRFAGMAHQTLFALIHPKHQARYRSLGGMHLRTAWRLARAYAKVVGLSEEHAYAAIEQGATTLLVPISARRQLNDLSDEMAMRLIVLYYGDVREALFKALDD